LPVTTRAVWSRALFIASRGIPPELERFVHDQVIAGHYASEDAVIRDALEQLRSHTPKPSPGLGSIGAMRDDADLLEQVTQDIMESRRTRTLRPAADG
jgi:Arc/MetJ-type ribon-helix-helix transcriptional regulator